MNIVKVTLAEVGFAVDHLMETNLGQQTWKTFVPTENQDIAAWIADGKPVEPAPEKKVTA